MSETLPNDNVPVSAESSEQVVNDEKEGGFSKEKVEEAIAVAKQWAEEEALKSAAGNAEFYNDIAQFDKGPTTQEEIDRSRAFWQRELIITESDPLLSEKLQLMRLGYNVPEKKNLLSVLKHLEIEEKLPLSVKKEAAKLVVPHPATFAEFIHACKKLVYEFSSRECDDEILRHVFHSTWDYQEALSSIHTGDEWHALVGEKLYMSEGLLWETEQALDEVLDFSDKKQYAQVAALLEFLKKMMDAGIARTQFVTLQDIIRKKVQSNTGVLLRLRAEEILNASDIPYGGEEVGYFRYGGNGIGRIQPDGLYVTSPANQDSLAVAERLELCEERVRRVHQEQMTSEHEADFLLHILEGEDYGPDAVVSIESEYEILKSGAQKIGNNMLRERYLRDIQPYFQKKKLFAQKGRPELEKEYEEKIRQSQELWRLCKQEDEELRALTASLQGLPFKKVEAFGVVLQKGVVARSEITQDFLDYKYLLTPAMRRKLGGLFSLPINRLPPPEQFQFLSFIKTKTDAEMRAISNFSAKYGESGFRTFLSLEHGKELGEGIVDLGHKLPKDEAQKIFKKYGELADAVNETEEAIRRGFAGTEITPELISAVQDSLLQKGRALLAGFVEDVNNAEEEGYTLPVGHIEKKLALLRADAALFASACKALSKGGEHLNLAEMKDVSFEQEVPVGSLSDTDRKRMTELYRANYAAYPKFQKKLLDGFEEALNDTSNRFFVLRYKGVIEGFYRLKFGALDRAYFGAFNMNPNYAGSGLGEVLMEQSLDARAKSAVIEATCTATLPIASNYIERGFIGVGAAQEDEIYSMNIVRNDAHNEMFPSKSKTAEDIMRVCESVSEFVCRKVPLSRLAPKDFELLNERGPGTRYVFTRYLRDRKTGYAYLVFEKTTDETITRFSSPEQPTAEVHQE